MEPSSCQTAVRMRVGVTFWRLNRFPLSGVWGTVQCSSYNTNDAGVPRKCTRSTFKGGQFRIGRDWIEIAANASSN